MPTITIFADKDADLDATQPTMNRDSSPGTGYGLPIRGSNAAGSAGQPVTTHSNHLIVGFPGSVPAGAVVTAATLYLYARVMAAADTFAIAAAVADFTETTVTWNTAPAAGADVASATPTTILNEYKAFPLAAGAVAAATRATFRGRAVTASAASKAGWFAEAKFDQYDDQAGDTSTDPYLSVTYTNPPTQPGVFTVPAAGQVVNNTVTPAWGAATDPDGDSMSYELSYSTNGGGAWTVLNTQANLTRVVNTTAWPATTTARFRVRAVDSFGAYGPYRESSNFTIAHNVAPNQPTITSVMGAANGGTADLAAGGAVVAPFTDPDAGDSVSAIYVRRKVGAGAWEYYNGGTGAWQAGVVKIAQVVSGYTFPAGKFANGTTYQLAVSYEDALGVQSPYSPDFTVTGGAAPTVVVTGPATPVTDTSFPIVTWSLSDPEGDDQERAQVIIEHGAYGATPGAGTQDYASGDIISVTARDHQSPVALTNGTTYRAFVRARANGQWSAWAYRTFTLTLTVPSAPTIVVTPQPTLGLTQVVVTGTHSAVAFPGALAQVQWLDDATWRDVRGGLVAYDGALHATIYDVEAPLNRTRLYRAITVAEV